MLQPFLDVTMYSVLLDMSHRVCIARKWAEMYQSTSHNLCSGLLGKFDVNWSTSISFGSLCIHSTSLLVSSPWSSFRTYWGTRIFSRRLPSCTLSPSPWSKIEVRVWLMLFHFCYSSWHTVRFKNNCWPFVTSRSQYSITLEFLFKSGSEAYIGCQYRT